MPSSTLGWLLEAFEAGPRLGPNFPGILSEEAQPSWWLAVYATVSPAQDTDFWIFLFLGEIPSGNPRGAKSHLWSLFSLASAKLGPTLTRPLKTPVSIFYITHKAHLQAGFYRALERNNRPLFQEPTSPTGCIGVEFHMSSVKDCAPAAPYQVSTCKQKQAWILVCMELAICWAVLHQIISSNMS